MTVFKAWAGEGIQKYNTTAGFLSGETRLNIPVRVNSCHSQDSDELPDCRISGHSQLYRITFQIVLDVFLLSVRSLAGIRCTGFRIVPREISRQGYKNIDSGE